MVANNEPFAFGGQDTTKISVRAIVIADSQFEIDAIGSLFRDERHNYVPLFEAFGDAFQPIWLL